MTAGIAVTGGVYAGEWADRRWHTDPLFTLLGFGLGIAVCVVSFIRWVRQIGRDDP